MSEYECFHPECDWSSEARIGRNQHFGRHDNSPELSLWLLSCADERPTYDSCSDIVGLSATHYERKFGSWNSALRRAGWEINKPHGVSDEELIDALREFADDDDRARYAEMNKEGPYSGQLYEDRFGSWGEALEEAGLNTYDVFGENNPFWKGGITERIEKYPKKYYENRPEIVERDDGCIICGEDDFDVHHISPLAYFPENGLEKEAHITENMVCLCRQHHKDLEGKFKGCEAERFKSKAKELYE
jgi:hypothetical protein